MKLVDYGIEKEGHILIDDEDHRQIEKWGVQKHSYFEWLAFITEELGELSRAISEYHFRNGDRDDIVREATQIATLAIKVAVMAKDQLPIVYEKKEILKELDEWVNTTGAIDANSSWYYELRSIIEDAMDAS